MFAFYPLPQFSSSGDFKLISLKSVKVTEDLSQGGLQEEQNQAAGRTVLLCSDLEHLLLHMNSVGSAWTGDHLVLQLD